MSSLYGPYGGKMQGSDRETRGRCLMPPAVEMQKQSQIHKYRKRWTKYKKSQIRTGEIYISIRTINDAVVWSEVTNA